MHTRSRLVFPVGVPLTVILGAHGGAQSRQPPTPSDYGQWESLAVQSQGALSPDGHWIVYGINRSAAGAFLPHVRCNRSHTQELKLLKARKGS